MSFSPLNAIHLDDACLVRISPSGATADAAAPHMLERLRPFANAAGAEITVIVDEGAPPWENEEIVALVKARERSQFIILCDDASPFADMLAMMALEEGYGVYVVFERTVEDANFSLSRLEKAGATLMKFDCFLVECGYGAKAGDETTTE